MASFRHIKSTKADLRDVILLVCYSIGMYIICVMFAVIVSLY